MVDALHHYGIVGIIAVLVGFLVRLLKAERLNLFLAGFGVPPIPKVVLPWLALVLGIAAMVLQAKVGGANWVDSLLTGLDGIIAGGLAIAGNETMPSILPQGAAKLVFGKLPPPQPKASDKQDPAG